MKHVTILSVSLACLLAVTVQGCSSSEPQTQKPRPSAKEAFVQDTERNLEQLNTDCTGGSGSACHTLGRYYLDGKLNINRSVEYLTKGCDYSSGESCKALGDMYYEGKLVTEDLRKARELYEKACSFKEKNACNSVGYQYDGGIGVRQDLQKAKEYYGQACDLGLQLGCDNFRKVNEYE